MALSRRTRFEVLRRDGHTCRYCGAQAPDVKLTVDHVRPIALGGSDDPSNLVTACHACNAGKGSMAPDQALVEDVDATSLLFASAIEEVARRRRTERAAIQLDLDAFNDVWNGWGIGDGADRQPIPRDTNWFESVERFLSLGLSPDDLAHYVQVAMVAKTRNGHDGVWPYFCGCCWREINTRQELALQLIEDGEV